MKIPKDFTLSPDEYLLLTELLEYYTEIPKILKGLYLRDVHDTLIFRNMQHGLCCKASWLNGKSPNFEVYDIFGRLAIRLGLADHGTWHETPSNIFYMDKVFDEIKLERIRESLEFRADLLKKLIDTHNHNTKNQTK